MAIARLIRTLAWIVAAIIAAAILLRVLGANPHNTVVSDVHDVGAWLVTPFKNLFHVGGAKVTMAVNWGIAAVVYLAVAHLLASLFMRVPGRSFGRRRMRPVALGVASLRAPAGGVVPPGAVLAARIG
jgi:hypothetical protein